MVSPGGLCALKFFAWEERHENHPQAVEVADYEIQSAGYFQLGCDVGELVSEDDHGFLDNLISAELKEAEDTTLCRELNKYNKTSSIEETLKTLNCFYQGLRK